MPKSWGANLAALMFLLVGAVAIPVLIVFAHALWSPWGGWVVAAVCYPLWFALMFGGWRRDWYGTTPDGKALRKKMTEADVRWRAQKAEREVAWLAATPDDWAALIAIGKGLKAIPGAYTLAMFVAGLVWIGGILVGLIAVIFGFAGAVVAIEQLAGVSAGPALWIVFAVSLLAVLAFLGVRVALRGRGRFDL